MKKLIRAYINYRGITIAAIFYIVISIAILRGPIFSGDKFILLPLTSPLTLENFMKSARFYPYTWSDNLGVPHTPMIISFHYVFLLLAKIFALDLIEVAILEYVVMYFLSGFGMFLLTYILLKKSIGEPYANKVNSHLLLVASFLAGLYYLCFPEFTIIRTFRHDVLLGYALAPWIFLLYIKSLQSRKYVILAALLFATLAYNPRWIIYIPLLLFMYLIFSLFWEHITLKATNTKTILFKYFIPFFIMISLFLIYNVQLILSFIHRAAPGAMTTLSTDLINVRFYRATILNLVRGLGSISVPMLFTNPPIPSSITSLLSVVPVVLAYLSLLSLGRINDYGRKNILFFSLLVILILLLFSNDTVPALRNWLILKAPFNNVLWRAFSSTKFQFFIGFSQSILLGYSSYCIFQDLKKKRLPSIYSKHLKYSLFVSVLSLLIVSIALPSWPLLTGDLNGNLAPCNIPKDYYQVNEWLKRQPGNFKVLWVPKFEGIYQPTWTRTIVDAREILTKGSSKATYDFDYWPIYLYYRYTVGKRYSLLSRGDVENLGELLKVLGIKYLIVHNDVSHAERLVKKELRTLRQCTDFMEVYRSNKITVFQNKKYDGRFFTSSKVVLVCGGLELMKDLIDLVKSLNQSIPAMILCDSQINRNFIKRSAIIVHTNTKTLMDLMIHYIPRDYIVVPTKYTTHYDIKGERWSKAFLSDPHHGSWSLFISKIPNHKWEFSYDLSYGFVFVTKKDTLTIRLNTKRAGNYLLFARVLMNPKGGKVGIGIDNLMKVISTKSYVKSEFVWIKVGEFRLDRGGEHVIKVENIEGINAINLLVLIPEEEYYKILEELQRDLRNKTIICLLEGASDFHRSNTILLDDKLITFESDGRAWQYVNIIRNGTYRLALIGEGKFKVIIGNFSFPLTSESSGIVYTPPFYLSSGSYRLEVTPLNVTNLVKNPSFEETYNGLPKYWRLGNTKNFNVSLDTVAYQGEFSLKISTSSAKPGTWSWITSSPIDVEPEEEYLFVVRVKLYNANSTHIGISGYFKNEKRWKRILNCPCSRAGTGTFNWKEFKCVLRIPSNVTKIRIIINAGWVLDKSKRKAITWVDDIELIPLNKAPKLSKVLIYSSRTNKSLNQVFGMNAPTKVAFYEEVNPTLWKVKINATKPFVLLFAETYDPLWKVEVYKNGKLVENTYSILFFSTINGFCIKERGALTLVVKYIPQEWFELELKISTSVLALCIAFLSFHWNNTPGNQWVSAFEENLKGLLERTLKHTKADPRRHKV